MSDSASMHERPTLPGIQDLLSDLQFDRHLRSRPLHDMPGSMPRSTPSPDHPFTPRSPATTRRVSHEPFPVVRPSHSPTRPPIRPSPARSSAVAPLTPPFLDTMRPFASIEVPNTTMTQPQPLPTSQTFATHPSSQHSASVSHMGSVPGTSRSVSSPQVLATDLPTFVVPADELPPDDDRRHGCGICNRRFNRPSSLMIHMNSHTGAQPFECPYPGCTRRFSVNSNMRRHYRNHRDSAAGNTTQLQPYPSSFYQTPDPYYHPMSSPSSSSQSSLTDSEDRADTVMGLDDNFRDLHRSERRTRSQSDVYPPAPARHTVRPRACTVQGCNCNAAPSMLRPAFQQEHSSACTARAHHR